VGPGASRVHGGDCRIDNVANVVARKDKHLVRQAAFPVKLAVIIVLVLFMNVNIHARNRIRKRVMLVGLSRQCV
jgi:hypothetical protein